MPGQKEGIFDGRLNVMKPERHEPAPVRTYGTTARSLDFTAVPRGSHWKASHLSLHSLVTSVFYLTKKRGRRNNLRKHGYLRLC